MASSDSEKQASLWVGLFILAMSIVYIFVSLGKTDWVKFIAIVWGFFLAGFLFFQAGISDYFRKKDYRKLGFGDIMVWITVGIAFMTLLNTVLLINTVGQHVPEKIINLANGSGVIVGIAGGVLSIVHIFMPRFK